MIKYLFLLGFLSTSFSVKSQTIPTGLKEVLKPYFFSFPENDQFDNWISIIEKDSTIHFDTTITRNSNDSFYFYLKLVSDDFISPINAKPNMVIMANNYYQKLPKKNIRLLIQMNYYADTSVKNQKEFKDLYKMLSKRLDTLFKKQSTQSGLLFKKNYERCGRKKKVSYCSNSFYYNNFFFPLLSIYYGKCKSGCNYFSINLYFGLNPKPGQEDIQSE